jgi:potassium-dependent mechanosensitive channel
MSFVRFSPAFLAQYFQRRKSEHKFRQQLGWGMIGGVGAGAGRTAGGIPPGLLHPWLGDVLETIVIVGGALVANWLLHRLWRWLRPAPSQQQSPSVVARWMDLVLDLGRQACHGLVWLSALLLLIWQVSFLGNAQLVLQRLGDALIAVLRYVLSVPLFNLGKEAVTLTQLLLFFGISLGILLLSRLIRNWLKHSILQRLGLERGSQEAIARVIGYGLAAVGMAIVLQSVGIDLSSLAVIAGVLGIGVGFGLQLLISNFISGVVLLLEQPLHVGDFIEVDGLLGTVETIAFRSTMIRTNDGLVVVIPNNRFLEKAVINRSYRGTDTRLHIPVSVAIGSDMALVTEALLMAARQEGRVLRAPAPTVWFKRFAEGAYEMELLVWINQPKEFEPIRSALNFLIEQEFSRRQIEIPLPQQEFRLRHPQELLALLRPGEPLPNAAAGFPANFLDPVVGQTLRDLLRQVDYFQGCSDAELRILIEQGYQKVFPAGSCLFQEQDPGTTFYIILAGQVQVFSQQLNQKIATLNQGDFFGEISLLTGLPRSATVTTLSETTLFIVDQSALQKLLQRHQNLAEQIAQTLAQRQNILQDLGILPNSGSTDAELEVPLLWIRQRLRILFGI